MALVNGTLIASPQSAPLPNAVVLVEQGKITMAGSAARTRIPKGFRTLDCAGGTIAAGFQNNHVHFSEPKWEDPKLPIPQMNQQLEAFVTRWGFTTVVDLGSDPRAIPGLRDRVLAGEFRGPRILTAGSGLYPPDGVPYYIKESIPPEILPLLAQPKTPEEAVAIVRQMVGMKVDVIKLFTGSWVARGKVKPMPLEIAKAAVDEAHRNKKLVFSHPSNTEGARIAIEAGVNALAHSVEDLAGWTAADLSRMVDKGTAMIPTLKLFSELEEMKPIWKEVADFKKAGGLLLFGTDTGYLKDYDPTREYDQMHKAGLTWRDVLASLTTNPASFFKEMMKRGSVNQGLAADLTVLKGDITTTPTAFAQVRYTLRAGQVIYSAT